MESWRSTWRGGFAPFLPTEGLRALREALAVDDPRLTQGSTTTPPPLMAVQDWPVEAGDALAFVGATVLGGFACTREEFIAAGGNCLHTNPASANVGQVEEFFAKACFEADRALGEPAACRWFLNFFDDTPRDEMRRELLSEVDRELERRASTQPSSSNEVPAGG